MSAISVTAASVVPASSATIKHGTAGATITAGQTLYADSSDLDANNLPKLKLADANLSSAAATVVGISVHGASAGQPIAYISEGDLTFNAVLTAGIIYVNGATAAGDINPAVDLTTGWRTSVLGVAKSTTVLAVKINNSDTAV